MPPSHPPTIFLVDARHNHPMIIDFIVTPVIRIRVARELIDTLDVIAEDSKANNHRCGLTWFTVHMRPRSGSSIDELHAECIDKAKQFVDELPDRAPRESSIVPLIIPED